MKLRSALGVTVALVLVALLAACSSISAGRITEKVIEPSYTWVQLVCVAYNKDAICTSQVPVYHTVPEKYRLDITDDSGEDGYVYVEYGTFESRKVGDWFDAGNN